MTETLSPVVPTPVEEDVERILRHLCDHHMTMATAESCTGGLLASLFTDVEGCSHAFAAGFVTYATETKSRLLGLDGERLKNEGAVSEWTARAMADGALFATGADVALAVTGFAGPAGEGDEAGLVHFACKRREEEADHRECHFGDIGRGPTRIKCIETAVEMLAKALDLEKIEKKSKRPKPFLVNPFADWACGDLLPQTASHTPVAVGPPSPQIDGTAAPSRR